MGNLDLGDFLNATFKVKERITKEQAWKNIQKDIATNCDRCEIMFKSFISEASLPKSRIIYAPVYHAIVEGKYSWKTTEVENVGNAFIGNVFLTTEKTNSLDNEALYIIDKNYAGNGGKLLINLTSYKNNFSNAVSDITFNEVTKLPLVTPLLPSKVVFSELAQQISREHKGNFDPSGILIALVLVPVLEVEYIFMSEKYVFYVDMYSGKTDTFDVPTSAKIVNTALKLEKTHKIFNIAKWVAFGISALNVVVEIIKSFANSKSNVLGAIVFFALISAAIFAPKKALDRVKSNIDEECDFSDEYITDNGKLTFKALLFEGAQILQLLFCLIVALFALGFMIG